MLETLRDYTNPRLVWFAYCLMGVKPKDTYDKAIVKDWQSKHNLTADGLIGKNTWTSLYTNAALVYTGKNARTWLAAAVRVYFGIDTEVNSIKCDFDNNTKAKVYAFQEEYKLQVDGKVGPQTWKAMVAGVEAHADNPRPVYYMQTDSRWKKIKYTSVNDSSQTIGSSGCGPTSGAMIVATWWDKAITPVETCEWAKSWGCRTKNSGTTATFFKKLADKYKAAKYYTSSSLETAISCLDKGGIIVVCFGPGSKQKWTKGG